MLLFFIHLAILLAVIYFGMKHGGISLGLLGGFGVAIYAFLFNMVPTSPPITVMLIILAVVTASATLQSAGGLDLMVQWSERLFRRFPKMITILAPISTFILTICVGTGHAVYSLQPVIADVAYKIGIRPERPMAVSAVASQMGITASPIAAAVTGFLAMSLTFGHEQVLLTHILIITIPATFLGMMLAAIWSLNRGKNLQDDKAFQERMENPEFRAYVGETVTTLDQELPKTALPSVIFFFSGVLLIIFLAIIRPHLADIWPNTIWVNPKELPMTKMVQIVMLSAGMIIYFFAKLNPTEIVNSNVFKAGMTAVISIMGIAWMSDTFIKEHRLLLESSVGQLLQIAPWAFAFAVFGVSAFVKSQAATLAIMIPLGYNLGLEPTVLIGILPSCYAYFFFCFYPSDLAAINFDRTGTTHVGKYLFNHSFMVPGLIGVGSATFIGYILASIIL